MYIYTFVYIHYYVSFCYHLQLAILLLNSQDLSANHNKMEYSKQKSNNINLTTNKQFLHWDHILLANLNKGQSNKILLVHVIPK